MIIIAIHTHQGFESRRCVFIFVFLHLFLEWHKFDDDLISTADGYLRKPDPAMYVAMLERHGLDPADCLAVGDRPIDAEAAAAAGLATATLESPEAPVDDRADHSVASLDELRPLLGLAAVV